MDVFVINFSKVGAKLAIIQRLSLYLCSDLIVFVITDKNKGKIQEEMIRNFIALDFEMVNQRY